MKNYLINSIALVIVLIAVASIGFIFTPSYPVEASVGQGGTYQSIVTAPSQTNTSYKQSTIIDSVQTSTTTTARPVGGTLGSVIITGAATGNFTLYDATTSDATLRTVTATSSLPVLATFPASTAAGTYTFDITYTKGIVLEFSGAVSTTTITYRQY